MNQSSRDRERDDRSELVRRIAGLARENGVVEPTPGLRLTRFSQANQRFFGVSRPSFCVIAQGKKAVYIGESRYEYDEDHYLVATAALPVAGQIVEATGERPYLGMVLELDPATIGSVMVEAALPPAQDSRSIKAVAVSRLDADLLDAAVRLLRLLDSPAEAKVLLPLVKREITFRLLMGEQSNRLRYISSLGGHSQRVTQAIERLRKCFDKPLRIERLAREIGMSASGFHQHFKAFTDLSPLQFQKQIRLQEARRLMLNENLDAARAGYKVGYNDPSHFCRDYKKLFGEAPVRDVDRLRAGAEEPAAPRTRRAAARVAASG
ncbi:MAG TPA: AraC family transcriptional regulator [Planctomycetia bacterium]|nr:AraC family transcriptional regulator [Planctomycetia bacterium]